MQEVLKKDLPPGRKVGESWELVIRPEVSSTIESGLLQGVSLADLWRAHKELIFGRRALEHETFPLLIKFLNAEGFLSLQVHPDDNYAIQNGESEPGKIELWHVIEASPSSELVLGCKEGVNRSVLERMLWQDSILELVKRIPLRKGDSILIPPGLLHAAGGGVLICEIQRNSDLTYRLWDWGRVDACGNPRQIQQEQALAVMEYDNPAPFPQKGLPIRLLGHQVLLLGACRWFAVALHQSKEPEEFFPEGESFHAIVLTGDEATLTCNDEKYHLKRGSAIFIPAAIDKYTVHQNSGKGFLHIFLPDLRGEVLKAIEEAGIKEECLRGVVELNLWRDHITRKSRYFL